MILSTCSRLPWPVRSLSVPSWQESMSRDNIHVLWVHVCSPDAWGPVSGGLHSYFRKLRRDCLPWRAGPKAVHESFLLKARSLPRGHR